MLSSALAAKLHVILLIETLKLWYFISTPMCQMHSLITMCFRLRQTTTPKQQNQIPGNGLKCVQWNCRMTRSIFQTTHVVAPVRVVWNYELFMPCELRCSGTMDFCATCHAIDWQMVSNRISSSWTRKGKKIQPQNNVTLPATIKRITGLHWILGKLPLNIAQDVSFTGLVILVS